MYLHKTGGSTVLASLLTIGAYVILNLITSNVTGCDVSSEFQCSNKRCVSLLKVNNTVNDCGDNSDESSLPCRSPMFSCRNTQCVIKDWVLDGKDDCKDGSDEGKIIGTRCVTGPAAAGNCCPCEMFIRFSNCQQNVCQCIAGHFTNELGTACIQRLLTDVCANSANCSDFIPHSSCVSGRCQCEPGYLPSKLRDACNPRRLGDSCQDDIDCSATISYGRCSSDGLCVCASGHYANTEHSCLDRSLQHPCTSDEDCVIFLRSFCHNNESCYCRDGFKPTDIAMDLSADKQRPRTCSLVTVGHFCSTMADCIGVASCECRSSRCACALGHIASRSGRTCRARRAGDSCRVDADCSHGADTNTVCHMETDQGGYDGVGQCRCADGYSVNPGTFTGRCSLSESSGTLMSTTTDALMVDPLVTGVLITIVVLLIIFIVCATAFVICKFVLVPRGHRRGIISNNGSKMHEMRPER